MTDTEIKLPKRTPAQRMFYRQYLPFIKEQVLNLAPVSYLTADQIDDNWGNLIPWNTDFANNIAFQSKVFFRKVINPSSPRAVNPEFLEQVIDQIIEHLMVYYMRAPHFQNAESEARRVLTKKLKDDNAFLVRAHTRKKEIEAARMRRAAKAAAEAEAQVTQEATAVAPRTKRPRIPVQQYLDKYNETRRAMRVDIEKIK